jgi:hypothetical protein
MPLSFGAFEDTIFFLKPSKETRQDTPDAIHGNFARAAIALVFIKVLPQVIHRDVLDGLANAGEHIVQGGFVVSERFVRTVALK